MADLIAANIIPKAQQLYDLARVDGYSHQSALGILGNVMHESGFNEHMVEGGGGGGYGLGQWTPRGNLYTQGAVLGYSAEQCETFTVQCKILLKGDVTGQWTDRAYPYDPLVLSPHTLADYKKERNLDRATVNYMAHWERPSEDPVVNAKELRKRYTKEFERRLKGGGGGGISPLLPVKAGTPISDPFGFRYNPVTGERELHNGTDYAGACGAEIYATMDATVSFVGFTSFRGNYVLLKHTKDDKYSKYLHMTEYVVTQGQTVKQGQVIGYIGSTGQSTGCHLHFTVTTTPEGELDGGQYLNPEEYLKEVIPGEGGDSDSGSVGNKKLKDYIILKMCGVI